MNTSPFRSLTFCGRKRIRQSAFTLVEVIIAMTIMLMVLGGVIAVQMFGMRMFQLTNAKMGASDDARKAIDFLSSEIRSAKIVKIGDGGFGLANFAECAPGQPQVGNAIQVHPLYPSTNLSSFARYYWNSSTNQLQRAENGVDNLIVVAHFVTNGTIFACEDALGNILTNNQNNRVIAMKLQIQQIQYPIMRIGTGNYFDYYQISTKTSPRAF